MSANQAASAAYDEWETARRDQVGPPGYREAFQAGWLAKTAAGAKGVTVEQLTEALTEFRLTVRVGVGFYETGTVADPQTVAAVLHATLSRIAALRPGDAAAEFVKHVAGMATDAERQEDHPEGDIEAAREDDTGSLDHLIGLARGIVGQP